MLLSERLQLKPQKLPAGTVLEDPGERASYKVFGVLGKGLISYVYEVAHLETRVHYAMKVVDPVMHSDNSVASLVASEIKINEGLSHRNVLKVEKVFRGDNLPCFLMGLGTNGDL